MTEPTQPTDAEAVRQAKIEELQVRAVRLAAVSARFDDAYKAAKAELQTLMRVRQSDRPLIPGTNTVGGTVSYKAGGDAVRVTDQEAFREWIDKNYPGEIEMVEQVREAFIARFVNANGVVVGPGGELDIPGIMVVPTTAPTVAVTVPKATRPLVLESIRGMSVRELVEGPGHE